MGEREDIDQDTNSNLDSVIHEVRAGFKLIGANSKDLILKLGNALTKKIRPEDICEEIKHILNKEIREGLISARNIERYCPDNWKKKTKPKKQTENDNLSFSENKKSLHPMVINIGGKAIPEAQDHNGADANISHIDDKYQEIEMDDIPPSDIKNLELNRGDRLEFEISILTKVVRKYTDYKLGMHEGANNILIHGIIDKRTLKVISAWVGRDSEQMQHSG